MTTKRLLQAAFGEPDPLLDKCKKAFKRAKEIIAKAVPDQLLMHEVSDPDPTKYIDITILGTFRLAQEMSEEDVTSIARRYWDDTSEGLERIALSRSREKSNSTPAKDIVCTFLACATLMPTAKQSTKNEPVPPPTQPVRVRSNKHEPAALDDDSDATSNSASADDDQLHSDSWI